ncbi:pantoate--beta-alanine ligase [Pasteuria penetrans]|uniref:pantoate--beta-alanine ligase n=1 Tax=Pasteuria penetrans TaxID=86005 RepID=UPI00165B20AF|nr:pantoate--beta-alanine ligase [Pasteuria penetrans]
MVEKKAATKGRTKKKESVYSELRKRTRELLSDAEVSDIRTRHLSDPMSVYRFLKGTLDPVVFRSLWSELLRSRNIHNFQELCSSSTCEAMALFDPDIIATFAEAPISDETEDSDVLGFLADIFQQARVEREEGEAGDSLMRVCTSVASLRSVLQDWSKESGGSARIGFVPTKGALHAGHEYMVQQARRENERVVLSVFVGSKQFSSHEEYLRYPRDRARDQKKAQRAGVDLLFVPTEEEVYAEAPPSLCGDSLEGSRETGHDYEEAAQEVLKLCQWIQPHSLYLGLNNPRRSLAIQRKVESMPFRVVEIPSVRERDGLICCARNAHLTSNERSYASFFHLRLKLIMDLIFVGEQRARCTGSVPSTVKGAEEFILGLLKRQGKGGKRGPITRKIESVALRTYPGFQVPDDLQVRSLILLVSVRYGSTCLMDHILWTENGLEKHLYCPSLRGGCGWMIPKNLSGIYRHLIRFLPDFRTL